MDSNANIQMASKKSGLKEERIVLKVG